MKLLIHFIKHFVFAFGWAYLIFAVGAFTFSCDRKPRVDPMADVPDLPSDTVYVTKIVSRCNYQYLAPNPKKAEGQLKEAVRQLDLLIGEYDGIIQAKSAEASRKIKIIQQLQKDEENYN